MQRSLRVNGANETPGPKPGRFSQRCDAGGYVGSMHTARDFAIARRMAVRSYWSRDADPLCGCDCGDSGCTEPGGADCVCEVGAIGFSA